MALVKKTQRSFAGGQIDKDLTGRQDLAKYSQGCLVLENFKVRKQGNVVKRPGTDLVCDFSRIKGDDEGVGEAKIIPLVQERKSGFYVLITGGRAYLVSTDGVRMTDGTWSRSPKPGAADGDPSPQYAEVPFSDSDLRMLDWCQSGDTVFFAHRSYPPGKLVYDAGTLTYERIQFRQAQGTQPVIASVTQKGTWSSTGSDREIEYCVTAVKDGIESPPSPAFAVTYKMPWPDTGSFVITVDSTAIDPDDFDSFRIYKKSADVFGLIGTTSNQVSFVSVSDGFSVDGTLCPSGFTTFDKEVHLRESGNRFATATVDHAETLTCRTADITTDPLLPGNDTDEGVFEDLIGTSTSPFSYDVTWLGTVPARYGNVAKHKERVAKWLTDKGYNYVEETTATGTSRSSSAQKSVAAGKTVTWKFTARQFSTFKVRLGGIFHDVSNTTINNTTGWYWSPANLVASGNSYYESKVAFAKDVVKSTTYRYTGNYTDFHASSARVYSAKLTFSDGTTCTVAGDGEVDQTAVDTAKWVPVSGQTDVYRRTYAEDELMYSSDRAHLLEKMAEPSVGATVSFTLPDAYAAKKCVSVKLTGYADSAKTTAAAMVVNGFAAFQGGKYVYSFTDDYVTPDLSTTPPKTEDHFVNPGEYPGCVALYSQRLVYASSAEKPFTFWMSCTGDLYNFDEHEYLRASDAITASTAALEMPRINRMLVHRDLMLFADGGEWQVAPSSGNAIAPSTVAAKLQSVIGCAARVKPFAIDTDIVFCDGSGETLYATRYSFASDGYESSNLSVLSQRIFRNNPIVAMAYAQHPEGTVECVLEDGTVASLVYMKEHDVCSWSRHVLGGGWRAKDVASNKSSANGSSSCALVARRAASETQADGTAKSVAQWAVLAVRDIDPDDDTLLGNLRMDAVRVETAEPTAGSGETVVKVGASKWAVGSEFTARIKTTSPEFTDAETAQMEVKNATECEVRVIDGSDFTARQPEVAAAKATKMKVPCPIDESGDDYKVAPGDADCKMPLAGTNSTSGSVVIESAGHLPLAILSVSTSYRVEWANHGDGGNGNASR
jgi:hypothetical protein